jgi:mRNA-degrading endonuclease RelE of RelBE toxin-antitoxin system
MEFRIADTFVDSLARLTGDEQKAVKMTAFDLQLNPANPSMSFHKVDKAKEKKFWSVRASLDIRLIVHQSDASLLLCYVHDEAYDWAERRKLETHPKTGAAQLVEIRETVKEIIVPVYVQTEIAAVPQLAAEEKFIFAAMSDDELLGYGVPAEWLEWCFASSRTPTRQISTRLRMPCNIPRVHCFWAENPAEGRTRCLSLDGYPSAAACSPR